MGQICPVHLVGLFFFLQHNVEGRLFLLVMAVLVVIAGFPLLTPPWQNMFLVFRSKKVLCLNVVPYKVLCKNYLVGF